MSSYHPFFSACARLPGRLMTTWLIGLVLLSNPVEAQVVSQGRAFMTLLVGQADAPVGNYAAEAANQTALPNITQHSVGWRISGGYHFADYFSLETAIARLGYLKSQAQYQAADTLKAQTTFNTIELNLIARVPLASHLRLDFTGGAAETSLNSTFSTQLGSGLPAGQANPAHIRNFGFDAGLDAEWMVSDHLSVIAGYHAYPNVTLSRLSGSGRGTFALPAVGLHIDF